MLCAKLVLLTDGRTSLLHRMGLEPDEIATTYRLTLDEVYAALAYYHDNRSEVDESIASDESFVTELRRPMPAKLAEKLRGSSD